MSDTDGFSGKLSLWGISEPRSKMDKRSCCTPLDPACNVLRVFATECCAKTPCGEIHIAALRRQRRATYATWNVETREFNHDARCSFPAPTSCSRLCHLHVKLLFRPFDMKLTKTVQFTPLGSTLGVSSVISPTFSHTRKSNAPNETNIVRATLLWHDVSGF